MLLCDCDSDFTLILIKQLIHTIFISHAGNYQTDFGEFNTWDVTQFLFQELFQE